LSKRLWLYSELTKVMWKPLWWSSFATLSIGVMWPWAGYGTHTAWALVLFGRDPMFLTLWVFVFHTFYELEDWIYWSPVI
jgi:hypothetical protein